MSDQRPEFRRLLFIGLMMAFAAAAPQVRADTILAISDLQLSGSPAGQATQSGWFGQDVGTFSGTTALPLT